MLIELQRDCIATAFEKVKPAKAVFSRAAMLGLLSLLAGCINGNYQDASEPDAAKLRFISSLTGSTLDYYDAQHCEGRTTGLLNNWMVVDTKRRVDMRVPPRPGVEDYLELKLPAGREVMLFANTLSTSTVCSISFYLTPEANAEYEAEFTRQGRHCQLRLSRLQEIDGKAERIPVPITSEGLPSCAGTSPVFPARQQ